MCLPITLVPHYFYPLIFFLPQAIFRCLKHTHLRASSLFTRWSNFEIKTSAFVFHPLKSYIYVFSSYSKFLISLSFHSLLVVSFEHLVGLGSAIRIKHLVQMALPCQNLVPQALPEIPRYSVVHKCTIPWAKGNNGQTEVCTFSYPERIVPSCVNSVTSSYPQVTFLPL